MQDGALTRPPVRRIQLGTFDGLNPARFSQGMVPPEPAPQGPPLTEEQIRAQMPPESPFSLEEPQGPPEVPPTLVRLPETPEEMQEKNKPPMLGVGAGFFESIGGKARELEQYEKEVSDVTTYGRAVAIARGFIGQHIVDGYLRTNKELDTLYRLYEKRNQTEAALWEGAAGTVNPLTAFETKGVQGTYDVMRKSPKTGAALKEVLKGTLKKRASLGALGATIAGETLIANKGDVEKAIAAGVAVAAAGAVVKKAAQLMPFVGKRAIGVESMLEEGDDFNRKLIRMYENREDINKYLRNNDAYLTAKAAKTGRPLGEALASGEALMSNAVRSTAEHLGKSRRMLGTVFEKYEREAMKNANPVDPEEVVNRFLGWIKKRFPEIADEVTLPRAGKQSGKMEVFDVPEKVWRHLSAEDAEAPVREAYEQFFKEAAVPIFDEETKKIVGYELKKSVPFYTLVDLKKVLRQKKYANFGGKIVEMGDVLTKKEGLSRALWSEMDDVVGKYAQSGDKSVADYYRWSKWYGEARSALDSIADLFDPANPIASIRKLKKPDVRAVSGLYPSREYVPPTGNERRAYDRYVMDVSGGDIKNFFDKVTTGGVHKEIDDTIRKGMEMNIGWTLTAIYADDVVKALEKFGVRDAPALKASLADLSLDDLMSPVIHLAARKNKVFGEVVGDLINLRTAQKILVAAKNASTAGARASAALYGGKAVPRVTVPGITKMSAEEVGQQAVKEPGKFLVKQFIADAERIFDGEKPLRPNPYLTWLVRWLGYNGPISARALGAFLSRKKPEEIDRAINMFSGIVEEGGKRATGRDMTYPERTERRNAAPQESTAFPPIGTRPGSPTVGPPPAP